MATKRRAAAGPAAPDATYTLSDLAQIRVLADPLRMRILSTLCQERTTKQVAQILGEKPTKLYHHVAALERAGLVRLARKRQNRGTVEKYFVAVARQFRADARAFASASEAGAATTVVSSMVSTFLESTASELSGLLAKDGGGSTLEDEGLLTFLEVRATASEIRRLRARLSRLASPRGRLGPRRYRLTIAFFPLDDAAHPRRRR